MLNTPKFDNNMDNNSTCPNLVSKTDSIATIRIINIKYLEKTINYNIQNIKIKP